MNAHDDATGRQSSPRWSACTRSSDRWPHQVLLSSTPARLRPPSTAFLPRSRFRRPFLPSPNRRSNRRPLREVTPAELPALGVSGYDTQKALLDSMFPSSALPSQRVYAAVPRPAAAAQAAIARGARAHAGAAPTHSRPRSSPFAYNHLMGSSDKDFITRIQLSQLVTPDPYSSDFYAQCTQLSSGDRSRSRPRLRRSAPMSLKSRQARRSVFWSRRQPIRQRWAPRPCRS